MDGFSVRAADTFGATEALPAYLDTVGEVPMGQAPSVSLGPGDAATTFTGGMLAHGADAVVMIERTHPAGDGTIEVTRPVAPGENVVQPDEDVSPGDEVVPSGHTLRPQDVGALLALGITEVEVAKRPQVAIVSTGDEVVSPDDTPAPGQVRDINTYTVSALVERAGGVPVPIGLFPDDLGDQRSAAKEAMRLGDLVVFSAGSSVGSRDMTATVLAELGAPGLLVHGISIKPGKPSIAGLAGRTPVFGLPGNPVSAMVVFDLLVRPVVRSLMGCDRRELRPTVTATLGRDVPSVSGRQDFFPVAISPGPDGMVAKPIFGKSNLIFTLVHADGIASVPLDSGGLYAGDSVVVTLF
jgi:molybdopterin molybdotransferase